MNKEIVYSDLKDKNSPEETFSSFLRAIKEDKISLKLGRPFSEKVNSEITYINIPEFIPSGLNKLTIEGEVYFGAIPEHEVLKDTNVYYNFIVDLSTSDIKNIFLNGSHQVECRDYGWHIEFRYSESKESSSEDKTTESLPEVCYGYVEQKICFTKDIDITAEVKYESNEKFVLENFRKYFDMNLEIRSEDIIVTLGVDKNCPLIKHPYLIFGSKERLESTYILPFWEFKRFKQQEYPYVIIPFVFGDSKKLKVNLFLSLKS